MELTIIEVLREPLSAERGTQHRVAINSKACIFINVPNMSIPHQYEARRLQRLATSKAVDELMSDQCFAELDFLIHVGHGSRMNMDNKI